MLLVGTHWPPSLSHGAGLGFALGLERGWGPSGLSAGALSSCEGTFLVCVPYTSASRELEARCGVEESTVLRLTAASSVPSP